MKCQQRDVSTRCIWHNSFNNTFSEENVNGRAISFSKERELSWVIGFLWPLRRGWWRVDVTLFCLSSRVYVFRPLHLHLVFKRPRNTHTTYKALLELVNGKKRGVYGIDRVAFSLRLVDTPCRPTGPSKKKSTIHFFDLIIIIESRRRSCFEEHW